MLVITALPPNDASQMRQVKKRKHRCQLEQYMRKNIADLVLKL